MREGGENEEEDEDRVMEEERRRRESRMEKGNRQSGWGRKGGEEWREGAKEERERE